MLWEGMDKMINEMNDRRLTTQEFVEEILRKAILNGYFKEGEPIETLPLEKKLGVSRMPIRLALQKLENEGLVLRNPHKKPIAVKLSAVEVKKMCDIRSELEALAIKLSAPRMTEQHFHMLRDLVEAMDQTKDPGKFLELNEQFHECIYQINENEILRDLILKFRNNVQRYLRVYLLNFRKFTEGNQDHRDILNALEAGNVDAAVAVIKRHIVRISDNVTKIIQP